MTQFKRTHSCERQLPVGIINEQLFEFMHRGQLRIVYDALARHTGRVNVYMLQQGAVISTSCLPVQVV